MSNLSNYVYCVCKLDFKIPVWPTTCGLHYNVPSIGLQDAPQLGPVSVPWTSPFRNFESLFIWKIRNVYLIQGLLLLKYNLFIKSSILFVFVPWESHEDTMQLPDVRTFGKLSGDVAKTSRVSWVCWQWN